MHTSDTRIAFSDEGLKECAPDVLAAQLHKLAVQAPRRCTLPDILGQKNMVSLNALAKQHGLKGYRKMPKSSLIMGLIPLLTDPIKFRKLLHTLDEEGKAFFHQICSLGHMRVGVDSNPASLVLSNYGVVFLYEDEEEQGTLIFVVPEEIRALYARIAIPD